MTDKIRWGILGTGRISGLFAEGLATLPDAELAAIGSRSQAAADAFAQKHNVPRRHASYAALANDPGVDVVYVGTPHSLHAENTLMGLNAGKAVLCEKPFTINAREAESVIRVAREKKLLVMEAMWTRFLPPIVRLRELLAQNVIGDAQMLTADFGFRANMNTGRLFDPALGGGALLDVGIYPVSLASMIFGSPSRISGFAKLGSSGVDEQAAAVLFHPKGQLALVQTAITADTFHEASIVGAKGRIRLHNGWWKGSSITITRGGGGDEFLEFPFTGNGYQFQAIEFMRCLREGKTESAIMPLDESLAIMKTLDTLRAQWGLKYPME